ncbi:hypothetical protein M2254_003887 [Chryseobacterium sp. BIGb0186]|uniref:CPCC family cysteine-rich protein n=1 Tax=Chryseobacterium sp. BIGb0186 TaxID=2940558 RepID=UPI000FBFE28A|nr:MULTISPECIES: CPCC family cysteine-rich protein [Chryseobacterium]MBM7418100.1 hypothetical protein [Chryseobacterium sp. JUb44]MDH6212303.1 hypothetical protein [Chryseobacterium sp. BIGb0186]WSO10916.1 CPCC family cysteine-rich protein [Chryseobacterium scophthalmum]
MFNAIAVDIFLLKKKELLKFVLFVFWEDDVETDLDVISNPNRMTLRNGRKNFLEFGACEEIFIKDVIKNPECKYRKGILKV